MMVLPETTLARLRVLHAQPHRRYHTQAHVDALLRWLALYASLATRRDLIEAAIWFHDAIYEPARADNEAQSAALARRALAAAGWPADAIERVAALVLATEHHDAAPDDADAIRAEYAFVDEPRYRDGRARVLSRLLARDPIYRTPVLREAWEANARANLGAELQRLRGG